MIIRDEFSNSIGPATQSGLLHERLFETRPQNGNITTTAGGRFIKQADSDYFILPITVRMTMTDFETLKTIAYNQNTRKYITPRRKLRGETAIRELEVIFEEMPEIGENKVFSNDIVEATMLLKEVIN